MRVWDEVGLLRALPAHRAAERGRLGQHLADKQTAAAVADGASTVLTIPNAFSTSVIGAFET
jgi:hypothetical protein